MYYLRGELTSSPLRASLLFGLKTAYQARADPAKIDNSPTHFACAKIGQCFAGAACNVAAIGRTRLHRLTYR
jgi:hypothetical protein